MAFALTDLIDLQAAGYRHSPSGYGAHPALVAECAKVGDDKNEAALGRFFVFG
ncbi:hypothetical protein [Candidatus Symbiobacter mobilis]|uniref:hypothetical protein n=1 Tax=Candidatus Symbiobacter mobilis TaxID=1436290 RepID=UPI0016514F21|nr:hypothetical protein [Candidatus Symbiobacter mobilis]